MQLKTTSFKPREQRSVARRPQRHLSNPTLPRTRLQLQEAVEIINSSYPEEIVRYYSPSYSKQLLDKLDAAATMQVVA